MIWTVRWSPWCDRDVLRLHPVVAERICSRILTIAATGRDLSEERIQCIPVPGAMAVIYRNDETRTIEVQRIHATRQ